MIRRSVWVWLLPALAGLIVHAPTLRGGFVYDDAQQIVGNPWVQELRHLPRVLSQPVWGFSATGSSPPHNYYRPVQMGLYNLVWAATGGRPLAFHALNILLHALITVTLAKLLLELWGSEALALGASLVFAIHPAGSEAVAWVASLPELTYSLFGLSSLLFLARSRGKTGSEAPASVALVASLFALALFSKETAIAILPIALVVVLVAPRRPSTTDTARLLAPLVAALVLYLVIRVAVLGGITTEQSAVWVDNPLIREGFSARGATALAILARGLMLMVVPHPLSADYGFSSIPIERTLWAPWPLAGLALLLGIAALGVRVMRVPRRDALESTALASSLFLMPLLPVAGFPVPAGNLFAERYLYLPLAGFSIAVVHLALPLAAGKAGKGTRSLRTVAILTAAVVLALLAATTVRRSSDWIDNRAVFRAVLDVFPDNVKALSNLAHELALGGEAESAAKLLEHAVRVAPDFAPNWVNLGNAYGTLGHYPEALDAYTRALGQDPRLPQALANRANVLLALGRADEALRDLEEAVRLDPGYQRARARLASLLLDLGMWQRARQQFEVLVRALPSDPDAAMGMARALKGLEDASGSRYWFDRAASLSHAPRR